MKLIKYITMSEHNRGTEETPDIVQEFHECEILSSDKAFEANYAVAEMESCNGEIVVEEVKEPEEEPTTDDVLNALLGVTE